MVAIAAAALVAFIGGLYFITHHKKEESETLPGHKVTGNGLPPKPEERWRYIKELESRQPGVLKPTEPSAGGEIMNQDQLTDEQRQLLDQMQADMRRQPTQLSEVPWNEQTPAQRQQTLQRQKQLQQQQQMQQWNNTATAAGTHRAACGNAAHGSPAHRNAISAAADPHRADAAARACHHAACSTAAPAADNQRAVSGSAPDAAAYHAA